MLFALAGLWLLAGTALGGEADTVFFNSRDGVRIAGTWTAGPQRDSPVLILLHMNRGHRGQWAAFAAEARSRGFGVLAIDLRGHGQSTRSDSGPITFSALGHADYEKMTLDVEAAIRWLATNQSVHPRSLGIVGSGVGANVALRFQVTHDPADAVVLVSPGLEYRGLKAEPNLKNCPDRPLFLIAADGDNYSAVTVRQLAARRLPFVEHVIVESGGHGLFLLEADPEVGKRMLDYLSANLNRPVKH